MPSNKLTENAKALGHAVTLITIAIWGTTFVSTKLVLEYITPVEVLFFRFALGYLLLLCIYPKFRSGTTLRDEFLFMVLGGTGIFLYFVLENIALLYTQASNVGIIVTSAPIFTAILAHYFLKDEPFNGRLLIGFVLAITGVGLIVFEGTDTFRLSVSGDLLAFFGSLSFAVYSMLLRKVNIKYHYILVTRKSFFYGLLWICGYIVLTGEQIRISSIFIPAVAGHILFLGALASCLCFVLWNLGVRIIGSVKASNYIYLVPAVTASSAIVLLSETVTDTMLAGSVLIVAGLFVSQNGGRLKSMLKKQMIKKKLTQAFVGFKTDGR